MWNEIRWIVSNQFLAWAVAWAPLDADGEDLLKTLIAYWDRSIARAKSHGPQ